MESTNSCATFLSKSKEPLFIRAQFLADRMLSDPSRPWCLIEMASLIHELSLCADALFDVQIKAENLESRLNSLEIRYSELLYSLSSK